jgi:competence protein ComEC
VGQGDCSVLQSDGETVLVDDGPASPYEDAGAKIVVPWLRKEGVDDVEAIFLSHPDEDHVGGTPAILTAYPGAKVVISDQFKADPAMLGHLQKWGLPVDSVLWLPHLSSFRVGELVCEVDCPDRTLDEDTNHGSMFIRASEGQGSAVFSGDAPKDVERKVEGDGDWHSEIDHVGHHGSRTATDPSWIAAVHPRYAIISVGRDNRYGLPNQEVIDRLQQSNVHILRTDRDGTITFDFNGSEFVPEE